jgi:hypothetical protein
MEDPGKIRVFRGLPFFPMKLHETPQISCGLFSLFCSFENIMNIRGLGRKQWKTHILLKPFLNVLPCWIARSCDKDDKEAHSPTPKNFTLFGFV